MRGRRRQYVMPTGVRVPPGAPGSLGGGLEDKPSLIKGWNIPLDNHTGYSAPNWEAIRCTRFTVASKIENVNHISMFRRDAGDAGMSSFLGIWDATSRALIWASAVGAFNAAWSTGTDKWETVALPGLTFTDDFFVGIQAHYYGSRPSFNEYGSITVSQYLNSVPWRAGEGAFEITGGPFAAVPDPLPAYNNLLSKAWGFVLW